MSEPLTEVAEPPVPVAEAGPERKDSKTPGAPERKDSKVPAAAEHKDSKAPTTATDPEPKDSKPLHAAAATDRRESKVQISAATERKESRPSIQLSVQRARSLSRLKVRRKSYGFGSVSGILAHGAQRASQQAFEFRRPLLTYLPTYQLEPHRPFKTAAVQQVVDAMVDEFCPRGYKYNPTESPKLAMTMALDIMRAIKAMNFDRYRIIVVVTVGQKRSQSYTNTISFIWDGLWDRYVDTHREFTTCIIQVTVFGVYYD
ncbi:tctex-1 family domain-containing protein [Phthorimaea operculella]|nr:tctex-1 family domain-containing protein [Phthorimaea operculella]